MSIITQGKEVRFADADSGIVLGEGMSGREPWGVWSCAPDCAFSICLPKTAEGLKLMVRAHAYLHMRQADVWCNDEKIATLDVSDHAAHDYELPIPARHTGGLATIRFRQRDVVRPCDLDPNSGDNRELGLGFLTLRLTCVD